MISTPGMLFSITLRHASGERKTVPVEFVATNLAYVVIRWDMAGQYHLNLAVNLLTPCSAEPQPRGKAKWYKKDKPQWKAEDIVAVRKLAASYHAMKIGKPKSEIAEAIAKHVETMPAAYPFPMADNFGDVARNDVDELLRVTEPFPQYTSDPDIEDEVG